jgi:hypothetical protein
VSNPTFIPGLQLCGGFYREAVLPILDQHFPGLEYSAALIGSGSEVLGFDDAMSTDHHWGPRLMLFLRPATCLRLSKDIKTSLGNHLPYTFRGYSTNFSAPDPNDSGVQHAVELKAGPVNHRVEILTFEGFVADLLGFDLSSDISPADWLTFPQQKLRTLTAGAVYHDGIGLEALRQRFGWYPRDVWLYLLAAGWARIGQEEHLMGRAGIRGDEIGSALIGARLVRDVMRLGFLMEKVYAPYPKWFGTAFQRLACAPELTPHLQQALTAQTWQERENHLVPAYECLARMHNQLSVTNPLPETARDFWGRHFRVMALHGYSEKLLEQISDPVVKKIASRPLVGNIDLLSDNTDFVENSLGREALLHYYLPPNGL